MATPVPAGGLNAIEHVIVLMQENRSFDNYFGSLQGVRGFADRTALRLPTGRSVFEQPQADGGGILPFSARAAAAAAGRREGDIQFLGSLPHGFTDATSAWNDGWWNNWIAAKSPSTMAFYDRRDIPLQYELADRFTVCDAYFCSVYGSTNPNRNYLWTGTTGYEPGSTTERAVTNAAYAYGHGGYGWTTYPERLEAAGISWQIYQEWDNFNDNAVEYFRPFKKVGQKILAHVDGGHRTTEEFYDRLAAMSDTRRATALAQFQRGVDSLSEAERRLFLRGAYRSEPGSLIQRLAADVKAGTLPKVSWVVPPAALSEHPGSSTPAGSANLIYDLLDTVAGDPRTWSRTAVLINFDENDGYFDHVPAPTAPRPQSGDSEDWYDGRPIGLGPRVPMTVVSPWTVGGFVSSEVFDHTSILRFLEKWTGVAEPNISPWRRAVCGDLTSVFDFRRTHRRPEVTQPAPVPTPVGRWRPDPPDEQIAPVQEPGYRPARTLPYRLTLTADVTDGSVGLRLANNGSRAAAVAGFSADGSRPRAWTVTPRDSVTDTFAFGPDGYDLTVHGPAGAQWILRGRGVGAEARLDHHERSRLLVVHCDNPSRKHRTLLVGESVYPRNRGTRPRRVRLAPGSSRRVVLRLPEHGWFDVVVLDRDDPHFLRRMTGRAGDGPGITDPAGGLPAPLTARMAVDGGTLVQGVAASVTVTLTNRGTSTLTGLTAALAAPAGWRVERVGQAPRSLPADASVDIVHEVTAAYDTHAGDLMATAYGDGDGLLVHTDTRTAAEVTPVLGITLSAPASSPHTDGVVVSPGRPIDVTATVANAGRTAISGLTAGLTVPEGWTTRPAGDQPHRVEAGGTAALTWTVTADGAAARDTATLTATIAGTPVGGVGDTHEATTDLAVTVGPDLRGHLLAEDFESLLPLLAPAADLNVPKDLLGWTRTPPEGWRVVNAPEMPAGTEEETGWSFMAKQFWFAADSQDRETFTRGLGIVAVADPDGWDDTGDPESRGRFDSRLISPAVTIPAGTTTLHLAFDSHYRQEEPQEAEITAEFDTGERRRLLHYSSAASGNDNAGRDRQNQLVALSCRVPTDATRVTFTFRLYNAMNDWYWSVDNIRVSTRPVTG